MGIKVNKTGIIIPSKTTFITLRYRHIAIMLLGMGLIVMGVLLLKCAKKYKK